MIQIHLNCLNFRLITPSLWNFLVQYGLKRFKFSLYQKLKSLKAELKKFNKDQFGGLEVRVQKDREDLERRLMLCPGHSIFPQLEKEKTIALCHWVMLRKVSWSKNPEIIGSTWEIRRLPYSIGLLKSDQVFVWWPWKEIWGSYSVEENGNWVVSEAAGIFCSDWWGLS